MEAGGGGSWYLAREEIERCSPSRRDCVPAAKEAELRATYCSFIRDVGIRLQLPQVTIATAIVLCHRFYLRQSHAKNEWQTVATVCIFLASKIEDTPCQLQRVVIVAYETMYRKDCDAAKRIYQKEILEKQKELILVGETLLLSTIRFDFNIQHPYEPLKLALKNLGMSQKEVKQVAVNLINDTLRTTLVVEFKPHYIAAGALFLAAKFNDVKLPSEKGKVWWHVFDVAPKQLQAVIHQMAELYMKRNPCSMDPAIKPIPGPIPTDKQQTIKTSDPSRRSLSNKFDREASRCMPVDRHRARKEPIKTIPAPLPIEKRQVNTLDPSRRRLPNNFDREASRCMLVDNSASHHSTVGSARNEAIKPIPAPVLMEKQQVNTSDSSRRHLHNNFDREASRYMSVDNSASYHSSVCSARNGAIKPLPAPIPMENQRIVNTSDPSRRCLRNNFDREASRCMPVDSSASRRLTVCSARNEAIKPPAPILMEKQQIINTSDLSRRVLSKKIDREASRCMPVDSSASHYSTVCSAKKELNKSLQTHVDRTLHCVAREGRLEKQSSRAALEADHVYHVYGRPQDINVTTIRTYIRRKRTNQEIGDHPSRSNKSDKDAWIRKQHGSVIVVDTKLSSFKKQKL